MLSGGAGLYFFYVNLLSDYNEVADFAIRVNGVVMCKAYNDESSCGVNDRGSSSCGTVATLVEGSNSYF